MPEKCTDNPRDCPLLPRVEALERANERHTDTHREIFDRLREAETINAVHDEKLDTIIEKIDGLANDVNEMKAKPAKRWEGAVDKIISSVIGVIVGFMLAGIFPK